MKPNSFLKKYDFRVRKSTKRKGRDRMIDKYILLPHHRDQHFFHVSIVCLGGKTSLTCENLPVPFTYPAPFDSLTRERMGYSREDATIHLRNLTRCFLKAHNYKMNYRENDPAYWDALQMFREDSVGKIVNLDKITKVLLAARIEHCQVGRIPALIGKVLEASKTLVEIFGPVVNADRDKPDYRVFDDLLTVAK